MSMNKDINLYSINDVIKTLKECQGRDWFLDDALAFASDLTGISEDALMGMIDAIDGDGGEFNGKSYL